MAAGVEAHGVLVPAEQPLLGRGRLRQLLAYAKKVFGLDALLEGVGDRRRQPQVATSLVVRIVFLLGLLRIRSFNALEPQLGKAWMQRALGRQAPSDKKICSADTLTYSLSRMDVASTRSTVVQVVKKAERNKVFREGWHGALRVVALDGWEPVSSFKRHCSACLTRQVKIKRNGIEETVTQYYHAFVLAMLVDNRLDMVVDMEPIRSADVRADAGEKDIKGHEGELTAGKRLVTRLRSTYGGWIDALVVDALYGNGPFLNAARQSGFGVISVLKKTGDEPLREAIQLWGNQPAEQVIDDAHNHEHIELWDCPGLETLSSYQGPIRVIRGVVHKLREDTVHNWCLGVTGCATRLSAKQLLAIGRGRWHIENTGFHQFTQCWRFAHVFTHGPEALPALFFIFMLAFNLLQLFLYRQLCSYGRDRGNDVTRTISSLIDEMKGDLERLEAPIAWDTS